MTRCAIYSRISTLDKGQTLETQLQPLREYAERRGWEIVGEWSDPGWSGAKASRPELDKMMALARKRAFDVVLVFRFDRFARSSLHLAQALAEFQSLSIDFVSLHEGISTVEPMGKLLFSIMAAIGEFELSLIRLRVLAGIQRARKNMDHWGRPKAIFDREEAWRLHQAGLSSRQIAAMIGGVGKDVILQAIAERQKREAQP